MQAIIIFTLVGILMAVVGGITSLSVDSTQQYMRNQVAQTREYFSNVEKVLTDVVVPRDMEIPFRSCPDGASYNITDIEPYLCLAEVSRLAGWSGAADGRMDPWRNPIVGYVAKRRVAIYARVPNHVVIAPVTAMVLVSGGPDGRISTEVQTSLAGLTAASPLADVLRVSAPDPATCNTATTSCDDIVYTFSDQRALEARWRSVQSAVDRILAGALRHYNIQYQQFVAQLPTVYASNNSELYDASGQMVINNGNLNLWQGLGTDPPSLATANLNSATTRTAIGVDEEFRYITDPVASGGSGMRLSFNVTSSPVGYQDVLTATLSNNGSPWGSALLGLLSYVKTVSSTLIN